MNVVAARQLAATAGWMLAVAGIALQVVSQLLQTVWRRALFRADRHRLESVVPL